MHDVKFACAADFLIRDSIASAAVSRFLRDMISGPGGALLKRGRGGSERAMHVADKALGPTLINAHQSAVR